LGNRLCAPGNRALSFTHVRLTSPHRATFARSFSSVCRVLAGFHAWDGRNSAGPRYYPVNQRMEANRGIRLDFRADNACSRRHTADDDRGIVWFRRIGLLLRFASHSPQALTWRLHSGVPGYSFGRDNGGVASGRAQNSPGFHRGLCRLSSSLCRS